MRALRPISITTLALLVLCAAIMYPVTSSLHDSTSSSTLLFWLDWSLSASGVVVSAIIIGASVSSKKFGTRALINELFGWFGGALGIAIFFLALFGTLPCFITYDDGSQSFDGVRYANLWISILGGLTLGFFGILAINARKSWFDRTQSTRSMRRR